MSVQNHTAPTPHDIARWLVELTRQLDDKIIVLGELSDAAADARRDAEVAFASEFLSVGGAMDMRRQSAILAAAQARRDADAAERMVVVCREAIRVLHAKIETGRTASANVRAELSTLGITS